MDKNTANSLITLFVCCNEWLLLNAFQLHLSYVFLFLHA